MRREGGDGVEVAIHTHRSQDIFIYTHIYTQRQQCDITYPLHAGGGVVDGGGPEVEGALEGRDLLHLVWGFDFGCWGEGIGHGDNRGCVSSFYLCICKSYDPRRIDMTRFVCALPWRGP